MPGRSINVRFNTTANHVFTALVLTV